jgi:hypothetical protein
MNMKIRGDQDISDLEQRLQMVYQPVAPRVEYRRELKVRLMGAPQAHLETPKPGMLQYTLLTAAGLVSGSLLLIFGVRAVQHLKANQVKKPALAA